MIQDSIRLIREKAPYTMLALKSDSFLGFPFIQAIPFCLNDDLPDKQFDLSSDGEYELEGLEGITKIKGHLYLTQKTKKVQALKIEMGWYLLLPTYHDWWKISSLALQERIELEKGAVLRYESPYKTIYIGEKENRELAKTIPSSRTELKDILADLYPSYVTWKNSVTELLHNYFEEVL